MPCTTILVGKKASYDGSTIIARNEDCPSGEFCEKRFAVSNAAGKTTYKSVIGHREITLPQGGGRYTCMPNADLKEGLWEAAGVNEKNVAMTATETLTNNERVLAADPLLPYRAAVGTPGEEGYEPEVAGGIGEEDMVTLVLPYATSARDGVLRLGALLAEHGTYEINGIAFADVDEIWWLETVGGHHWIAHRVPDDCYVTMPNQLGLDSFDLDDALGEGREHLCSPDLRDFIEKNHLDLSLDGRLNPRDAFGTHSDSDHVYNTPRAWDIQRFLNPSAGPWETAAAHEPFGPESDTLPWARVPERKVTIEDVKYALSLHYQGTVYDPYGHIGTPATRGLYRPIGINRNCQLAVLQIRPYADDAHRALQWIALGSNAFNALVPFYTQVDDVPAYVRDTPKKPSTESFYWANRLVAAMADASYGSCLPHVERYQEKLQSRALGLVLAADEAADDPAATNQAIADVARETTDDLLANVLFQRSLEMKNGFSRSDN